MLILALTAKIAHGAYVDVVDGLTPIAYWRLGESEGTTATDRSGNSLNGTYDGPTLAVPGVIGSDSDTAVDFDGINDQMTSVSSTLLCLTGDVSVSLWINPGSFPEAAGIREPVFTIVADASGSGTAKMAEISFNQGGDPVYTHEYGVDAGSQEQHVFSTGNLSTDTWYNLVVIRDVSESQVHLYINGGFHDTYNYTSQAEGYNSGTLYLGQYDTDKFHGTVDELAVFDYELSSQNVSDLYDAANPVPEPATICLLGLGALVLIKRR
ncbi:MAG: PEP-CTERM sorting domain-containing protein [Planctomycetota bacterium]|nr:MAG: PEP-CTERM sorting domain-containing protein [Planctomycetota bacterium]